MYQYVNGEISNEFEEREYRERKKTRAFVVKCTDGTYLDLVDVILKIPDCQLIYNRSSSKRLMVLEEDF